MLFSLFITFSADRNNLNTLLILVREFDKYFDEMQSLMFSIIAAITDVQYNCMVSKIIEFSFNLIKESNWLEDISYS